MDFQRMPIGVVLDGELVHSASYLQLQPVPRAAGTARRFVRENTPVLPEPVADCLELLTTELVTNAILHARTELEVGVITAQVSVLITVHDLDLVVPLQNPYADREGGWGLGLVEAMAQSWSTFRHPGGGKTMWFRVLRVMAPDVADDAAQRNDGLTRRRSDSLTAVPAPNPPLTAPPPEPDHHEPLEATVTSRAASPSPPETEQLAAVDDAAPAPPTADRNEP